jgi:acyl-CoA synthetase (AMP-forming)/AMP-acid ligase II
MLDALGEVKVGETIWAHWERHMERNRGGTAIVHWVTGEEPHRWSWGDLGSASLRYAAKLAEVGVRSGDVCALIIRHHRDFYPLYMAVSRLGALPSVLAYPNSRLHPEKFRLGLAGMARRSGLNWILTERELESTVRPLLSGAGTAIRDVCFPFEWNPEGAAGIRLDHPQVKAEEPCLMQHSSGTTGLQKAVVLSHRAVLENVRRYGAAIHATPEDRVISWLPLYHDMGLIAAFYLPLTLGLPLVQLSPFEWVQAPVILLEAISQEKGTLCWLPNFAYNLMADRTSDEDVEGVRLDSLRMLVNCSEPVRAESHDRFYKRFARLGLRRAALGASYAMAETTFAATQTVPGAEAGRLWLDREKAAEGMVRLVAPGTTGARVCVSSGRPISGCELRTLDDEGNGLPEDRIGEIAIRSVSLFDGYRNNPEQTRAVLRDGWYLTGDYGFIWEGEYYVIGRKKDIIIVAGKNVYPEDIEDAINQVGGVLPGRVIAFGLEDSKSGTEQICVVLESELFSAPEADQKSLRLRVREAGMTVDLTINRVYLAPPRWLIKSSAGKPSRSANRDRALAELRYDAGGTHDI